MSEHAMVPVSDLIAQEVLQIEDGNHGEYRPRRPEFVEHGTAFIRAADMSRTGINFDAAEKIDNVARARIRKGIGAPLDVLISHKGTVGKVAIAPPNSPVYVCSPQTTFWRSLDHGRIDPHFLYYTLISKRFQDQLLALQGESDMAPYVSLTQQRKLLIPLPEIEKQFVISSLLRALDDKIAVNERIADVSDELIRQCYLDWAASADDAIRIDDLAFQIRDTVPADSLTNEDNYIGLEHMPRRNVWLSRWSTADTVTSAKARFRRGDVLFGKLRPYFHKVGIAFVDGVSSTDILVIRPQRDSVRGWLLAAISSDNVVAHASNVGDGTRMPRVKWSDLANYQVPWVGDELAMEFNRFVTPLSDRIRCSVAENRTLAELRDTLLPKLMSGETRVRDAEKVVEDVM